MPAQKPSLIHVGTSEMLCLPDYRIQVRAKIDTGADSSAIWASNVSVRRGRLTFNLLAPGADVYRPQPVVTDDYKTTKVKNSFGHSELRYKVLFRVSLGGQTFSRWFSLADRSRSTYPVLLGKDFLSKNFVVDVSQQYLLSRPAAAGTPKVLVLGAAQNSEFFDRVRTYHPTPVDYVCDSYESLIYYLDNGDTRVVRASDGQDIADYSLVYFKSHQRYAGLAAAAAEYLRFRGRPFVNREVGVYTSVDKLSEYMKLMCAGLPVPMAICADNSWLLGKDQFQNIVARLGVPFVLKSVSGTRGKDNYLITARHDFENILRTAPPHLVFLAQKYIANDGFMRVYVLGGEVAMTVWRDSCGSDNPLTAHLNKPAGSLNATLVDPASLAPDVRDIAVQAAGYMNRQVAGIDMVQDKNTRKWYILEVNNAPQFRTGSYVDEKSKAVARFIDKELNR